MSVETVPPAAQPDSAGVVTRVWNATQPARRWFRAFRRTRPFWGGLWLIIGGWQVLSW